MTDQPTTHPTDRCGQTAGMVPHPPHKFMRNRALYQCPGDATPAAPKADEAAVAELARALRLTREYVGADLLPAVEGWSWYDALRRWAPHELPADPTPGPAPTQAADSTAARTARIRSLTLPASGRQLDPHLSRRLPGILHLGHRPTSLDMALIAEAADVSVDWLLYGDAGTPAPAPAGLREQPAPTVDRQTAAVLAALHRSAEADVSRVIDLYERWVKAGPPPLGASLARWWDMRLAELHNAILNPAKEQS
jgi:hypothetical protein